MSLRDAAIAVNRFGIGARPGELDAAAANPRRWLLEQLEGPFETPPQFKGMASLTEHQDAYYRYYLVPRAERIERKGDGIHATHYRELMFREIAARINVAATTPYPFRERLVRFWYNHFVVPVSKQPVFHSVAPYEREVIRPNITGKFRDFLVAVEQSPCMIIFLDNNVSYGPNSEYGKKNAVGLNENLGREILELHTLGVEGGYTQEDVIELAKGITGWSVGHPTRSGSVSGAFHFYEDRHEPGPKRLLGKTYEGGGVTEGLEMLADIARHPSTATFVSSKLVQYFTTDTPDPDDVKRIADVFRQSDGDLMEVTRAVVELPSAWEAYGSKLRQPWDFVAAVMRATGDTVYNDDVKPLGTFDLNTYDRSNKAWCFYAENQDRLPKGEELTAFIGKMSPAEREGWEIFVAFRDVAVMGQRPYYAPGPQGWYDKAENWGGPDTIMKRVEWAIGKAQHYADRIDPVALARATVEPLMSKEAQAELKAAPSVADGLSILLSSPAFQRR